MVRPDHEVGHDPGDDQKLDDGVDRVHRGGSFDCVGHHVLSVWVWCIITYYFERVKGLPLTEKGSGPHIEVPVLLDIGNRDRVLDTSQLDRGVGEVKRHLVPTELEIAGGSGDGDRRIGDQRDREKERNHHTVNIVYGRLVVKGSSPTPCELEPIGLTNHRVQRGHRDELADLVDYLVHRGPADHRLIDRRRIHHVLSVSVECNITHYWEESRGENHCYKSVENVTIGLRGLTTSEGFT